MAEAPQPPQPPSPPPRPPSPPRPPVPNNPDPTQYWCYQCEKRVPVETRPDHPDLICFECKNGFVESISTHPRDVSDDDTHAFSNEIAHFLRFIASSDDDAPPSPPLDSAAIDNDRVRIELEGWNNDDDHDDDEDRDRDRDGSDDADDYDDENEEEDEDFGRRHRRDVLRHRLREFGLAANRRNRILDWAELLMQLEDQSVEFRVQAPGFEDGYVGNPGDYIDEAGYDTLLQTLAESDSSGRRGAPPAAKSAVEALRTVEVKPTDFEVCAICKDRVFNNEEKVVKQLPCGHMYHGNCIVPWLGSRNTCPVCRFELPTDDPEYEEDRRQRSMAMATTRATDHGCSSSSGGGV